MSELLRRHSKTLRKLHKLKNRKAWLKKNCTNDLVHCLSVCCKNLLAGRVPLTKDQKKSLARRKKDLRKLASKKVSRKQKRVIIQKGGFLGALLGPIISVLGSLFNQ